MTRPVQEMTCLGDDHFLNFFFLSFFYFGKLENYFGIKRCPTRVPKMFGPIMCPTRGPEQPFLCLDIHMLMASSTSPFLIFGVQITPSPSFPLQSSLVSWEQSRSFSSVPLHSTSSIAKSSETWPKCEFTVKFLPSWPSSLGKKYHCWYAKSGWKWWERCRWGDLLRSVPWPVLGEISEFFSSDIYFHVSYLLLYCIWWKNAPPSSKTFFK